MGSNLTGENRASIETQSSPLLISAEWIFRKYCRKLTHLLNYLFNWLYGHLEMENPTKAITERSVVEFYDYIICPLISFI